jgi:uncharacterized protein YecT (DUF1311 family)
MFTTTSLVLALLAGQPQAATADPDTYSAAFSACMDQAAGVTGDMRDCSADEYARLDVTLNATYRELMGLLEDDLKTELREAQRAWIAFRDAECDYRSLAQGGTLGLLIRDSCWLDLTSQRVRRLKSELATVTEFGAPY